MESYAHTTVKLNAADSNKIIKDVKAVESPTDAKLSINQTSKNQFLDLSNFVDFLKVNVSQHN